MLVELQGWPVPWLWQPPIIENFCFFSAEPKIFSCILLEKSVVLLETSETNPQCLLPRASPVELLVFILVLHWLKKTKTFGSHHCCFQYIREINHYIDIDFGSVQFCLMTLLLNKILDSISFILYYIQMNNNNSSVYFYWWIYSLKWKWFRSQM